MTPELRELCALAGVHQRYTDQTGTLRETGDATARALLTAMGHRVSTDAEAGLALAQELARQASRSIPAYTVVEAGAEATITGRPSARDWHLVAEDGDTIRGRSLPEGDIRLPPLPMGIHTLSCGRDTCIVLAAPPSLPPPPRAWGVMLPLYGLRGSGGLGLGTYSDLARAVAGLGAKGADFVGINPIHMGFFPDPGEYSPYAPSHRRRLNPAHLTVPGEAADPDGGEPVDYGRAYPGRRAALEAEFRGAGASQGFEDYLAREGAGLQDFALHQALSDRFGALWRDWPEAYRSPASPEVARFARENAGAIRFHAWLQYRTEAELARVAEAGAGMALGLYLDIAVGTHPFGAETWLEPEVFARGVSLGAPPDAFSEGGQVWGLAPLDPGALIRAGFRPVAEMLRTQFRYSRLLRIDHILGFERAFWVPEEAGVPGAYVTMPKAGLLAVARIEAARAGGTIIGEDLGNIPEGLHRDLEASGLLGCRVVMFELNDHGRVRMPEDYPEATLASFGTHDLPTYAGWREGRDIAAREALGSIGGEAAHHARAHRAWEVGQLDAAAGGGDVAAMERFVARTGSRLVALQIEDILDIKNQPNLPGTVSEYPNWRQRLPISAQALAEDPRVSRAARTMSDAGR